jgi:hypothetical protein
MYDVNKTLIARKRATVQLTGTAGTANITGAGGLTKLVTFGTSLTASAAAFVVSHAAAYLAQGIVVTSLYDFIVFTEVTEGTGFVDPVITNVSNDLTGEVISTLYPEPVALAEMKTYILDRYEADAEKDALLSSLITAARELAEEYCNRSFIPQTIEYTEYLKQKYSDDPPEFLLPFPNHLTIEEVKVSDVVTTDYTQEGISRIKIVFTGRSYSTDSVGVKYYIKYTAGECSAQVKNAIFQIAKDMYENRGKDPLTSNGFLMLTSQKVHF